MSEYGNKVTKQRAPTSWRPQREGLVRTQKVADQMSVTYILETTEGGTCQNMEGRQPSKGCSLSGDHRGKTSQHMERKQLSKGLSLPGDHRGRDLLGCRKKVSL